MGQMTGDRCSRRCSLLACFAASASIALSASWTSAALADPALDALVAAYPDHLAGYDGTDVIWKDGTRMPVSDGQADKSFEQLLDRPDIKDQFVVPLSARPGRQAAGDQSGPRAHPQ